MERIARILTILVVASTLIFAASAASAPEDYDIPGGHFYTQTGGGSNKGYAITDDTSIAFWSEFNRLGGVQAAGYPVSQRFVWNGFPCQAMQRVVFQWQGAGQPVAFVNVFDLFTDAGKDDWLLSVRQVPKPLGPDFDAGLPWEQKVAKRLALLDANPAIKAAYYSVVGDPVTMNGLPTSPVTDMGNNYTLRAQRVVFQQWKEDVAWASRGQVTVALGGQIAAEAGLLPDARALAAVPDSLSSSSVLPDAGIATPTPLVVGPLSALPTPVPPLATPQPTPTVAGLSILPSLGLPVVTLPGGGPLALPSSGKKIAFHSNRDGNFEIYTMKPDGTSPTRLTNHPAKDIQPAWSPDGRKIAFASERDGNFNIYVMSAEGSGLVRITDHPAADYTPTWSPDGLRIAFVSERAGGSQIWKVNADGSNPVQLTLGDSGKSGPAWSPDGSKIVFSWSKTGYDDIFIIRVDGSGLQQLTTGAEMDYWPFWSPNGRAIGYTSVSGDNPQIFVMNADSTGKTRITTAQAIDIGRSWSSDLQYISFTSSRGIGSLEIFIMASDGSRITRLTNNSAEDDWPVFQP